MQRMQFIFPQNNNSNNNNNNSNNSNNKNGIIISNCNYLSNTQINDDDNNHLVPNSASMIGRFDDRLCVPYRIRGILGWDLVNFEIDC